MEIIDKGLTVPKIPKKKKNSEVYLADSSNWPRIFMDILKKKIHWVSIIRAENQGLMQFSVTKMHSLQKRQTQVIYRVSHIETC